MNDTSTCPSCQNENLYFNGLTYECPDCGYGLKNPKKDEFFVAENKYEQLSNLKESYFELEMGEIYESKVEHKRGIEDILFIPLAKENNRNRIFVLHDVKKLLVKHEETIKEILKMDFKELWEEDFFGDYHSDFMGMIGLVATDINMTLIDENNMMLYDFKIAKK
jgi:hypothetical protein